MWSRCTVSFVFAVYLTTLWGCNGNSDRVLLQSVTAITLRQGEMTAGRRSAPIPQLACVGGSAGCDVPQPSTVHCYNRGWSGKDVQWECQSKMDKEYKFDSITVSCEGYDNPDDPYILRGSCGLKYNLDYTGWNRFKEYFVKCIIPAVIVLILRFIWEVFKHHARRSIEGGSKRSRRSSRDDSEEFKVPPYNSGVTYTSSGTFILRCGCRQVVTELEASFKFITQLHDCMREYIEAHFGRQNHVTVFKPIEVMINLNCSLVEEFLPTAWHAVEQYEMKSGSRRDRMLRSAYQNLVEAVSRQQ